MDAGEAIQDNRPGAAAAGRPADGATFLLNQPADRPQRRRAGLVLILSVLLFGALVPFVRMPAGPLPAFIPMYESALLINDTITAVLLFGQYRILRSRALMVLACAYLYTALMTAVHALTFPGVFAPAGLLGAGPQTTASMYVFWHAGFPLFALAYAALKLRESRTPAAAPGAAPAWQSPAPARDALALAFPLATLAVAAALSAWATLGQPSLPTFMDAGHFGVALTVSASSIWTMSLVGVAACGAIGRIRCWTCGSAWRWSPGRSTSPCRRCSTPRATTWASTAGRVYGLIAGSAVLIELLLENGALYARLVRVHHNDRRQATALRVARDEARSADAAKGLFLANMSHEIRTPMNAVIGLTNMVLQTRLDETQRDYLTKVQTSSKALLSLLNDILDYSKIEAGKVALEAEEFSPEETIENVGNLFSAKVEEAGLDLLFEIDRDLPPRLVGDALRLTQVLNNLVGNAIKFTSVGEVVIGARVVSRTDDDVELAFSVRDTGIGVTPEQADRLFNVFQQAERSTARKYGGTGLGLAICKRLVELMGGRIEVTPAPGGGSIFGFTLPVRRRQGQRRAHRPAPHPRHAHARRRRPADRAADPAADAPELALPGRHRLVPRRRAAQAAPRRPAGAARADAAGLEDRRPRPAAARRAAPSRSTAPSAAARRCR